ncbi:MAG: hypothetical protein ABSG97_06775 [Sedimentisphaerales bacterium]|jgi:hypothetical protein
MVLHRKTNTVLGFLAGLLAAVFGTKTAKPSTEDLKRAEFTTSTQRLGVRFTDRIRDVFRFKWLKKM